MKIVKKSICIILALISILALNACGGDNSEKTETTVPAVEMSLNTIFDDFVENAVKAENTHIGQRYRCEAQVETVEKEYIYVKIWSGGARLYYEGQDAFVMNISAGDIIAFEGTFTKAAVSSNYNGGLTFGDVKFIEVLYRNSEDTYKGRQYECEAEVREIESDCIEVAIWSHYAKLYFEDQDDFIMNVSTYDVITFKGTLKEGRDYGLVFEDVVFIGKVD